MMPVKGTKDKNSVPPASPKPFLQTSSRESRIAYPLAINDTSFTTTTTNSTNTTTKGTAASIQKRKKHWRSPSNPIDFNNMSSNSLNYPAAPDNIMLKRKSPVNQPMNESPCQATITTAILSPAPKGQELNFDKATVNINNGRSGLFLNSLDNFEKELKMTKKDLSSSSSSSSIITLKPKSQSLHSYETLLLRGPQDNSLKFQMLAELCISPIVSTGSSDYTSTRRHVFNFDSSYCQGSSPSSTLSLSSFDSTSLAHGHIDTTTKGIITFSRSSLLQVILRNPQDNAVAGIFVVKLDLTDMPPDSRTILRQKAYKTKSLQNNEQIDTASDYLAKFIEIPLTRSYDSIAHRQRIHLDGPIKLAFTFNRSNLRYTTPRRSDASAVEPIQKTRTIIQFPSDLQKYFPIFPKHIALNNNDNSDNTSSPKNHDRLRASSLTDNVTRSFQHGSLCL